jgi:hypothetical protein
VNIAHTYSHLELAKGFLLAANYSAALTVLGILKRDVLQAISFFEDSLDKPLNLGTARRNISVIEIHVARALRADPTFKSEVLDKAVHGLSDCLIDWENRFITHTGP